MNIVIYARVSSSEQVEGYSIDAQIELVRAWAAAQGHSIINVYTEPGKSARTAERPVFQRMITHVCAGEAQAVVVHKVDRFARNLLDLLRYKKHLSDHGVAIYSVAEEFLNGDSPENTLVTMIMGATAQYVAWNIGREAAKGQDHMASSGRYPGSHVPLGYVRVGVKQAAQIQICPIAGPQVEIAFSEFATGNYTLRQWVAEARQRGIHSRRGKPINRSSWHHIFRNPFYIGKFIWREEVHQGDHPVLITVETWETVQRILDDRNAGGATSRNFWLLRGLLWSEVHARPMSGNMARGQFPYYRAQGRPSLDDPSEHSIRAENAEAQVIALLGHVRALPGQAIPAPDEWLLALLSAPNLGYIYPHLPTDQIRRRFLQLIFLRHGLHVNRAGRVSIQHLAPGFEVIEEQNR